MKRVLVDMDEVIADPMNAMIEWYKEKYDREIDFSRMEGSWAFGFPEEHQPLIRTRLNEPGFFRHLPVMKDSQRVLAEINKKYELFIVSAATEFPNSLKDKIEWLGDHFSFISWKQVVLCGDKRLCVGDYLIDDHTKNLVHFTGKPYLYNAAHNQKVQGYERLNNWEEVAKAFL